MMKTIKEGTQQTKTLIRDLAGLVEDTTEVCVDGEHGQSLSCKTPKGVKMLDT